eukprot:3929167-Rhodomonas_salina.2
MSSAALSATTRHPCPVLRLTQTWDCQDADRSHGTAARSGGDCCCHPAPARRSHLPVQGENDDADVGSSVEDCGRARSESEHKHDHRHAPSPSPSPRRLVTVTRLSCARHPPSQARLARVADSGVASCLILAPFFGIQPAGNNCCGLPGNHGVEINESRLESDRPSWCLEVSD